MNALDGPVVAISCPDNEINTDGAMFGFCQRAAKEEDGYPADEDEIILDTAEWARPERPQTVINPERFSSNKTVSETLHIGGRWFSTDRRPLRLVHAETNGISPAADAYNQGSAVWLPPPLAVSWRLQT